MRAKNGFVELILYVIAFAGAAIMLMPFAWMVATSLKLPEEVQIWPPSWGTVNALSSRIVPASVDHSSYSSINYGAMSLQQLLGSGGGPKKELPDVLVLNLVGTAPIRGTFDVKLSGSNGKVEYATSVNQAQLSSLISQIDSMRYPSSFRNDLKNLKSLEDQPVEYIKAFTNLFQYGNNPVLSRINFVNGLSKSAEVSEEFFKRYGPILSRNPRLSIKTTDSSSTISQKNFVKHFLVSSEYIKSLSTFLSKIQKFKKGLGTLAPDSAKLYLEIENFISRIDLEKLVKKRFGKVLPSLSSLINLYEMRTVTPVREWLNLLIAFNKMHQFYVSSKKVVLNNPEIVFKFPTQNEEKDSLKEAISKSGISSHYSKLALSILKTKDLEKFIDTFAKELNSEEKSSILKLGVSPEKTVLVLRKLSDIVANMKILYSSLTNDEQKKFNGTLAKDSRDMKVLANDIVSSFGKAHPNITEILNGQLKETHKFFSSSYGEKSSKLESFLSTLWNDQRVLTKLTNLFNNVYYTMKILRAPSIVSKVQYFPKNGKIKIFLDNINSVWFSDAKVTVKVHFNFLQVIENLFQNYVDAWNAAPFARYYLNTIFVATVTTFLSIVFGVMAAFAFSKLHFFGRDFFFMLFLSTMMIPGEVLLVPNFITIVKFGWLNSYYALIVPWIASAFVIFLIRQNFMSVPDELFDAAKIDGASAWRFLWTVMVPLSKPVIITGALLNFVGSWNAFLWVLIVTNTPSMRTLPVGLQNFSSNAGTLYNQLMAASTFSMLPIVILFLFAQKYFIQGIARSGLK